ncbi:MAG: hypothetical protein O3C20_24540, partial [Verrucomicrobia bacterium]|nr:hypothetical protein [Verrucomicrobiota bacterium]
QIAVLTAIACRYRWYLRASMKVGDMPSEPRDELHLEIECAEYPILSTLTPTIHINNGCLWVSAF